MFEISIGDLSGFIALGLILAAATLMALRRSFVRSAGGLALYRKLHIAISTCAGLFLVVHIAYFFSFPYNDGLVLGYASTAAAVVVWLTGTAFVERWRDTLFFHGTLTVAALALMAIHASVSGANLPLVLSALILGSGVAAVAAGASRQAAKFHE
ncbi:MAG TPA: hypothetical protein VLU91_00910 [Nitrososphaerales archaeon]|nr:hypothetical protein [Nitrososphaerales archaeon]